MKGREGWEVKKLEEVCEILDYLRKPITKKDRVPGDYPYYGANGIQDYVDDYIFDEEILLVGEDGAKWGAYEQSAFIVNEKCWVNNHAHVLRIHKNYSIKYICNYLNFADLSSFITGAVVRKLNQKSLRSIPIPIPPLPTQYQIVAQLDALNTIMDKKRAQLEELDKLAQATFYHMFGDPVHNEKGWEVRELKNNVEEMFLGPFGSALKKEFFVPEVDSHCMVYEQKHAIRKTLDLETRFINKDKYEELKRFEVRPGDFIMSCRGTIGEIYRLPANAKKGVIHPSVMKIRIRTNIYTPVFFEFLLHKIVKEEDVQGAAVKMAVTAKSLGAKKVIVPPLSLQTQFAQKIEHIEKQKALIERSLADVQQLFDYTMDSYFN